MVKRLIIALAILVVSAGVAVAASETSPGRDESSHAPPGFDGAAPPDDAVDAAGEEEEQRQEDRDSNDARREREDSRQAYAEASKAEAIETAKDKHGDVIHAPEWRALDLGSKEKLGEFLGRQAARIDREDGPSVIVESSLPLRTRDDSGDLEEVDARLEERDSGFRPRNGLAATHVPKRLADGLEFSDIGVSVKPENAGEASDAELVDGKPFFANSDADTDFFVGSLPAGLEAFWQLRSEDSPQSLRLNFDLPDGAGLDEVADGAIEVVDRDGQALARVAAPTARDADGEPVAVSQSVDADSVVVEIDHRSGDWAYPILVDPAITEDFRKWSTNPNLDFTGFAKYSNRPAWGTRSPSSGYKFTMGNGAFGRGLYAESPQRQGLRAGDYGEFAFFAPGTTYVYQAEFHTHFDASPGSGGTSCEFDGLWSQTTGRWESGPNSTWSTCHSASDESHSVTAAGTPGNAAIWGVNVTANQNYDPFLGYSAWATISYADTDKPTDPTVTHQDLPPGWTETATPGATATATDTGFGIKTFKLYRTTDGARTLIGSVTHPCTGDRHYRCPAIWSSDPAYKSWSGSIDYQAATSPEGDNTLSLYSYDAAGNESAGAASWSLKVDRTAPEVGLSGTLWDHRDRTDDHRFEGLYGPDNELHVLATDGNPQGGPSSQRSGVKEIAVDVDGEEKYHSLPQTCVGDSCPMEADWTLHSDDFPDGRHTITVTAADGVGHVKSVDFTAVVDRRGDIYHAKGLDADPTDGGKVGPEEWARAGTHISRHESADSIATRQPKQCDESRSDSGLCDQTRSRTRFSDKDPGAAENWTIYRGAKEYDRRVNEIAEILEPTDYKEDNAGGRGPIESAAQPFQALPPAHGTEYLRFEGTDRVNGVEIIDETWIDQRTHFPIKQVGRDRDGNIAYQMFWTYSTDRLELTQVPSDHFHVARPDKVDTEKRVEYGGSRHRDKKQDEETLADFQPLSLGLLPKIGASSFCLATTSDVYYSAVGAHVATAPGSTVAVDKTTTADAIYNSVGPLELCIPGEDTFGNPPLVVSTAAKGSAMAKIWRDSYKSEANRVESDPNDADHPVAGLAQVALLGEPTTAYLIRMDAKTSGALMETQNETLIVMGPFDKSTIQQVAGQILPG